VSCLVSCVPSFHFLPLSWLETALLFRFFHLISFSYFLSITSIFLSPFLHCFFVICFFLFLFCYLSLFCIRQNIVRAKVQALVPHTRTRDFQIAVYIQQCINLFHNAEYWVTMSPAFWRIELYSGGCFVRESHVIFCRFLTRRILISRRIGKCPFSIEIMLTWMAWKAVFNLHTNIESEMISRGLLHVYISHWRGVLAEYMRSMFLRVQSEIAATEVNRFIYFYYAITSDASVGSKSRIHRSTVPIYSSAFLLQRR